MLRTMLVAALVTTALACGGTDSPETRSCTVDSWRECEPPSDDARSGAWPEQRALLGQLADATERAVATPARWYEPLKAVERERGAQFIDAWGPLADVDLERRGLPIAQAHVSVDRLLLRLPELEWDKGPGLLEALQMHAKDTRASFAQLETDSMFHDPFGQTEPRRALFAYAKLATIVQFLAKPSDRRTMAVESTSFLEARLREWEAMQRRRLGGRSVAEVDAAIASIGVPELRRLMAAWQRIEGLEISTLE